MKLLFKALLPVVFAVVAYLGIGGSRPVKAQSATLTLQNTPARVYFSLHGGATDALVEELGKAKASIIVQAYSFTSAPIAQALKDASKRSVKVRVVLDKSQRGERYTSATFLVRAGIPVWIDASHQIAHNKVMDGETVVTGSFNFTKAAEQSNAENMLILKDSGLAEIYTKNWEAHLAHSEVFEEK
jgi:phosphatidylserine/phosphatidylglycerophosphate/cardiolipin synthase-like enzyme